MKNHILILMTLSISTLALADGPPAAIRLNVGSNINHIKIDASGPSVADRVGQALKIIQQTHQ